MNLLRRVWRTTVGLAVLAPGSAAWAQRDREHHDNRESPPRIVLYERPNFRGEAIELLPGATLDNLASVRFPNGRKANDEVSSILVEPGAAVVVNVSARFRGESLRLTRSVDNLTELRTGAGGNWNDAISSVRAEDAPLPPPGPRRRGQGREPRVILYRGTNFTDDSFEVFPGDDFRNLADVDFEGGHRTNDSISSIRVIGPVKLRVYSASGYREHELEVVQDIPNLRALPRSKAGAQTWDDCISSFKVEQNSGGGGGRDDRPGRGAPDPEPIVRRIYQELLQRGPTPDELTEARRKFRELGWTEQVLRDDVRRSLEFRQREADAIIVKVYRDMLGRDPDPVGLRDFRVQILEHGWTERQVRETVRGSEEYRQRHAPPPPNPNPANPPENPAASAPTPPQRGDDAVREARRRLGPN